jgi:hypothetical protein
MVMTTTWVRWTSAVWVLGVVAAAWGASPAANEKSASPAKVVEMFAGMESGDVEVTLIFKDSKEGNLLIKNKTDRPLTIKLPEAFAAVPILAQAGLGGAGGLGGPGGRGNNMGGGGMQGMGGGMMGGMGMGGMGMGMGGMFNVPPEKVQKVKIVGVCLDHGKDDPNPRVPYKPIPIETYAKDPAVVEVIKLMLRGQIDQHSAQAAAWHLQNGLSWQELAAKIGVKHIDGRKEPYFLPQHLQRALAATQVARQIVEQAGSAVSVGEELARSP